MVSDFEPVKRRREDPFLPSPSRKMSRTSPPTSSPRAYKHLPLKRSCPPEIMTQSTTSAKDIPLPPSPVTRSTIASSSALPEGDEESIKPERRSISPIGPFDTTQTSYSAPAVPKALPATPTDTAHPSYTAKAAPDRSDAFSGFDRLFADFSSSTLDHPRRPWSSGDGDRLIPRQAQRSGTSAGVGPGVGAITPSLTSGPSSVYSSRAFTPDQSRLETAINSLHNVIVSLQATNSDQATYILRQADLETRLHSMDRELGAVREENLRLEVAVRREREGRKRIERHASRAEEAWAAKLQVAEDAKVSKTDYCLTFRFFVLTDNTQSNAQSSLHHLHLSQSTSASRIQHLESQIREYSNENHSLRNHVSELEMEVSRLAGAFDIVRSDHARRENDLKRRLEEAEFMHIALKESGEKMGRELEVAKRRVGELEMRAKGGFI